MDSITNEFGRRTIMANSARNIQLHLNLDRYGLLARNVALTANVPFATMWRAMQGQPITTAHAAAIRNALWQISGDFYTGPIETSAETVIDLHTSREQRSGGTH
jgi:hypothetical protein